MSTRLVDPREPVARPLRDHLDFEASHGAGVSGNDLAVAADRRDDDEPKAADSGADELRPGPEQRI